MANRSMKDAQRHYQGNTNQNHSRIPVTSTKMPTTKPTLNITNAGKNVKELEALCIVGKNTNWPRQYWKQLRTEK